MDLSFNPSVVSGSMGEEDISRRITLLHHRPVADAACGLLPRHRKHIPERVFERRREIEALPALDGTGCKPTVQFNCMYKKGLNKHFLFISQSNGLARADGRTR